MAHTPVPDDRFYPPADVLTEARRWAAEEPDATTASELGRMIDAAAAGDPAAEAELTSRFAATLAFGTAGLRAELGAGPNRMNRQVVRRTAAGIAAFITERAAGQYTPRAVIGFDARYHSDVFAEETAAVFAAAGIEAHLMPSALPTPVLAYAVRRLEAEVGVMVTASHNPPRDNGYKVYLGGRAVETDGRGAQIVAPADAEIASHISYSGALADIPLAESGWHTIETATIDAYVRDVVALSPATPANRAVRHGLQVVLTSMHGVGADTMGRVFAAAGFTAVTPVEEQAQPDPDFPTVDFPNPEEPGAIDLALATAERVGADLVIANDPDADRCGAAARFPDGWRMLRGDEVGVLLGAHAAETATAEGTAGAQVFANSIVSSRQLSRVAAAHGISHRQTLTGFKWISRVPGLTYGYEEALGYCVAPELVKDKDGISAALLLADLAASLAAAGSSIPQRLEELAAQTGAFATDQLSVRVDNLALLTDLMARLRAAPPTALAGAAIAETQDLNDGADLPPTDALLYVTEDDSRVIVRPSGTEPKLKAYLETVEPVAEGEAVAAARDRATDRLARVRADIAAALGLS
ncbi:phospho-sugar mutase [Zhihengliuella flava]|uniref:Phosphomannomutase n=1 Tax=Zhihengliuella flava TaxID=1285193 RepID=A0A931D576_9MICC|nr:phospho-sugar mutase [Zhihengliuella flava]MBG6083935.1 phosphomannomutase [Zhihengliuella flava]